SLRCVGRTLAASGYRASVEGQDDQSAVVIGRPPAGVRRHRGEDRVAKRGAAGSSRVAQDELEPLEAEGLAAFIGRLDQAVGEEHEDVTGGKRVLARGERLLGKETERKGGEGQRLDPAAGDPVRRQLSGV